MQRGLIEQSLQRPTHRNDPEARAAGQAWVNERVGSAMGPRQPHASREEQVRRKWAGNWVQGGQQEGYREPGTLFGSQPPRPDTPPLGDWQVQGLLGKVMSQSAKLPAPSGFGAGGYFAGSNPQHALASSSMPAHLGSMRSAMDARGSLAANGMTLHPGRQGAAGSPWAMR